MDGNFAQSRRIRSPVGAGLFYPDDRDDVLEYLRSFALEDGCGRYARAIIAPHGAWSYSGALAANAFSSAMGRRGSIRKVIILGPCHDKREKGLFLSNSHYFYTPLGNIAVDHELSEEFEFSSRYIEINDIPHLSEHSIEILLPFVKFCFPRASIVPILMGQPDLSYILDLAKALKTVLTPVLDEILIVVSCNLSCDEDVVTAKLLAQECIKLFSEKNASALTSAILGGRINACGGSLVVSLLESGLLDKTKACFASDNLLSAVGIENNTVYYSEGAFV